MLPDDRTLLARATEWAAHGTAVAAQMAVPLLAGVWLDGRLGSGPVFALMGGVIGLAAGIWSLLRLTRAMRGSTPRRPEDRHEPPP